MLIKNTRPFSVGVFFTLTFIGVLLLIFSPVFSGKSGLEFADDSFNKLAKGSSYFIPKVAKSVERVNGKPVTASVEFEKPDEAENAAKLFTFAGTEADRNGTRLTIKGDLGIVLRNALKDADAMYRNDGTAVSGRYGYDEKKVLRNWWQVLSTMEKSLKKEKRLEEAKIISDVMKKGIEPGYNFYKIDANKVSEHAGMMSWLLVFYIAYTMWWGYAIFYLFEGLGLTMKKARIKREA